MSKNCLFNWKVEIPWNKDEMVWYVKKQVAISFVLPLAGMWYIGYLHIQKFFNKRMNADSLDYLKFLYFLTKKQGYHTT